ncbi:MAG TPA: SH3 domain-containing protein [Terriglobales bacterium]|nr:SH3 domain-containing protein [Terriglobales bacterium]
MISRRALFALLVSLALLPACRHSGGRVLEIAYVSGVQVNLRDRVAAVYEKAGLVKNGDRVEVLDRDRRFAKVRTATGEMGWMEQRYLVSQQVYDQLQKLTTDNANDPVQAQGVTRNDTNLHVEPGRETDHLYQIVAGEKLAILKRGTAEKNAPPPAHAAPPSPKPSEKQQGKEEAASMPPPLPELALKPPAIAYEKTNPSVLEAPKATTPAKTQMPPGHAKSAAPAAVVEDWWLVRDSHGRVGWVLARMVDVDAPLDIAQYAEGQRIVAFFVLNQVQDQDKKVPQYLTVLTEPKDGLPFDFNQIRVFTWNVKRHRYETAYRERMEGMFPVTVSQENFDKEGVLPVFTVRVLDDDGKISERKYKLNTPIVRRVLAPGEEPAHSASHKSNPLKSGRRHKH